MICPRCQAAMADNVVFCTTCGTAVGAAEQPPAGSSSMTRPVQPGYRPPDQPGDNQPAHPGQPPQGQPSYRQPAQPPPGQPSYSQAGQPPPGQPGYRQPGQPGHPPGQPGYAPPGQPGYAPPGQPSYSQPAQPGYAPPGQPSYSQPAQPGYAPPGQPGYRQPTQPAYPPQGQPGYQQPGYGPPGYTPTGQPGYGPPGQPGYFPPAPHATPAFAFDLKRLSGAEQVIGGACVVLIITLFLPWFGISGDGISVTASGFSAHGYLVIALLTAVALIAYLVMRTGWDDPPVKLPVPDMPLLLATTGLQLLIVLIAFLFKPAFTSWQFGAYLGLIAALAACAAAAVPAIGSMQGSRPGS